MVSTLKALEQDRDHKAQVAMELHAKWKAACKEAEDARDKFIKASSQHRHENPQKWVSNPPAAKSIKQPPVNLPDTEAVIDYRQSCGYYEELIRKEANEITKSEMRAELGRIRLEELKASLNECQKGESPIPIQDELRTHDVVTFWTGKLLKTYRDNYGYTGNSGAELYGSELDRLSLCHIAAELVDIIAKELKLNLKVIEMMKNRDGMLTTPGNIKDSLWYLICKSRGIDLDTKSVKERPAAICKALEQWPTDNAFQEGSRIMRHWAALTHTQRSAGGKKTQPVVGTSSKEKIRDEYTQNPGKSVQDFCDRLSFEGWNLPEKRTVERYTKDLRQKNKNAGK